MNGSCGKPRIEERRARPPRKIASDGRVSARCKFARSLLMRKPNYPFERAERDRAKKARNDKKLQRQQERAVPRAEDATPEPTAENKPRES